MDEGDFGWALAKMRDGYKVHRAPHPDDPMHYADGELRDRDGLSVERIASEHILAQDWELHLD